MISSRIPRPPLAPVRRYGYADLQRLFAAIDTHTKSGATARLFQYGDGRGPVDISLNGTRYLVRDPDMNGAAIGTFDTIDGAVLAADRHVDADVPATGGAA